MEGILLETESMLAHGRMDLPLNLCFATLRGDDLLLRQLLKRGLDPNESDNNGRTALVCKTHKPGLLFYWFLSLYSVWSLLNVFCLFFYWK